MTASAVDAAQGEEAEHRHTAPPGLRSRLLGAAAAGMVLEEVRLRKARPPMLVDCSPLILVVDLS